MRTGKSKMVFKTFNPRKKGSLYLFNSSCFVLFPESRYNLSLRIYLSIETDIHTWLFTDIP